MVAKDTSEVAEFGLCSKDSIVFYFSNRKINFNDKSISIISQLYHFIISIHESSKKSLLRKINIYNDYVLQILGNRYSL